MVYMIGATALPCQYFLRTRMNVQSSERKDSMAYNSGLISFAARLAGLRWIQ